MNLEELCANCGKCCMIYNQGRHSPSSKKHIREVMFGDIYQYGVEPMLDNGEKCDFLGKNGCIIERSKRPEICLKFECGKYKELKYIISKK